MITVPDSKWVTQRTLLMPIGGELHATIQDTHLRVWVENDRDYDTPVEVYLHGENYRSVEEATLVANMFFDLIGGNHTGER